MEIILTVIIIMVSLAIAPFVALGAACIVGGLIIGVILFFIVALVGVDPSTGVFVTCIVSGIIVTAISLLASKATQQETSNRGQ